ncbi:MAG: 4Fe-4S dicluster domain-containing protein [Peptococcaceae bacterium]|jgi:Fe-S-cluster-containing dehydrogenase component|nr:4Fe-4S dicluster domain-containing protein [Peptococcaceae bacterium]
MARYAMFIDQNKCTGCNACRVACQMQWGLPPTLNYNWLEECVEGQYPHLTRLITPVQCQHCDNPPCEEVCPTKATYRTEEGVVLIDSKKCIGCKYCMVACPYNARMINENGVPEKCRFCYEYVRNGETPVCVSTCMCNVRVFGDLDDPSSPIHAALADQELEQLLPAMETNPRIFYAKKRR